MARMRRRLMWAGVAVAAASALAGCGANPFVACPAIGWSNEVVVSVSDPQVAAVDLCDERGCASEVSDAGGIVGLQPPSVEDGAWRFALPDMSTPDEVTVRAISADGAVLAERAVRLEWVRTGGSEQCGGPGAARLEL
jgi:hypothetical protein